MRRFFRGLVEALRSSGYRDVEDKLALYRRICTTAPVPSRPAIRTKLNAVASAIKENRLLGLMVTQYGYEKAWGTLHEARNDLCQFAALSGPESDWAALVTDVGAESEYLPTAAARAEFDRDIRKLRQDLRSSPMSASRERAIRSRLRELAEAATQARNALWNKADLKRTRITKTAILVVIATGVGAGLMASGLPHGSVQFFVALVAFGALGGLLSSFFAPESVSERLLDFYINRRSLYLRPVVGGALALLSYAAIQAEAFSVFKVGPKSPPEAFLFVGAFAGFSEQLFLKQLFRSSGTKSAQG
jgi:hypothetical protein